jgi:16S rRNA (guanine527-N7)-methyltransferase
VIAATVRDAGDFAAATGVSRETMDRLQTFADLLTRWQRHINLVAPNTLPELWHRHFYDSAQLLPLIPPQARVIADLGSGAGFPGLVLALCGGGRFRLDLYESDSRKAEFLRTVIRQTEAPAQVHEGRIEAVAKPGADVITTRALAPLPALLHLMTPLWRPGMCALLLKGRRVQDEIDACSGQWDVAYDRVPSVTDSAATILVIRSFSRVGTLPE